ncbi:MAG: glycosyltransferase family 2 protein [Gemmatimonadaceae bacterium]
MSSSIRDSSVVTAVIAAHDESANIEACIASVGWASEVIVVENDSVDDTIARATSAGATVISPHFTTIGAARNQAIARAATPWILVLDADERCTPELAREIEETVGKTDSQAFRIPRRNFFLGKEVRHGGWQSDKPVRLFRQELRYNANLVHEHVDLPNGVRIGETKAALLHYTYASLDQYFEKFSRYSRWWAQQNHAKGRRASAAMVFFRPPARFVNMYLLKGGFLDGAHGLLLSCLAAASVMAKYARLWERSIRG